MKSGYVKLTLAGDLSDTVFNFAPVVVYGVHLTGTESAIQLYDGSAAAIAGTTIVAYHRDGDNKQAAFFRSGIVFSNGLVVEGEAGAEVTVICEKI